MLVTDHGTLPLTNAAITSSGNSSSTGGSTFHGRNAVILASNGSAITFAGSTVTLSGTGANGILATGAGSTITANKVSVNATANGAHGAMATDGGVPVLTNVNMTTAGTSAAAIVTDRGGGAITPTLRNGSSLTGAANPDHQARKMQVTLDGTSTWAPSADSYVTSLTEASGVSGSTITNIAGNGHNLSHDAPDAANSWLGGKTYDLKNGGKLLPRNA